MERTKYICRDCGEKFWTEQKCNCIYCHSSNVGPVERKNEQQKPIKNQKTVTK